MGSQQSKEERLEEARTTEKLMGVIRIDMDNSDAMNAIQRRDPTYAAEMKLLPGAWEMGLPQGITAGLLSLAFFSKGNSIILRRDQGTSPFGGGARSPASSFATKLALYTFSLTVSFANTVLVSAACQDKEKILSRLAETPLVEGRSILSDSFCDDLTREYKRIHPPEYWKTVHSPFLRHLGDFVHNCELRRSYENKLRKDRGLSTDQGVSIPPPGVPATLTPSDSTDDNNGEGMTGEDSFTFGQDEETIISEDWADSFATDQEDSENGKEWK